MQNAKEPHPEFELAFKIFFKSLIKMYIYVFIRDKK